jgi:ribosome-associated protein
MINQDSSESSPMASDVPPSTICLDDYLKACGIVETGGQAKVLIQGGQVTLNGMVETRRRKKLVPGDVVRVGDEVFTIEEE